MNGTATITAPAVRALASIDYDRLAALPFGVPPDTLPEERLAAWLAEGPAAATLYLRYPDQQDLDPGVALPADLHSLEGPGGELRLVPLSASGTGRVTIGPEFLADVCVADVTDGAAGTLALAGGQLRIRWDAFAADGALFPLPQVANEALLLQWPASPPPDHAVSLLPGALTGEEEPGLQHLLPTPADRFDGELDPTWLRAPCAGLVRFERYHHLALESDGRLARRRPSGSGRLAIMSSPLRQFPAGKAAVEHAAAAGPSPLAGQLNLAFEHVEARSVLEPFAALLVHHTRDFGALRATERIRQDRGPMLEWGLADEVGWAIRCWLALAEEFDTSVAPPAALRESLRRRLPAGKHASVDEVAGAAAELAADADGLEAYAAFALEYFAEVLCGATWLELGIEIDPGGPEWASDAQADLGALQLSFDGWIPVYAGAPLGRAAPAFAVERFEDPHATWLTALSTYDVEARFQLSQWEPADPPPLPLMGVAVEDYATDDLALEPVGRFGWLRLLPPTPGDEEFTTEDWLGELLRGTQRLEPQAPLVAFDSLAAAGHAAAGPVRWSTFTLAREARATMDLMETATVAGVPLQRASINWWAAQSQFTQADGTWFTLSTTPDGKSAALLSVTPRPTDPYRRSGATSRTGTSAYDTFDLLAALRATSAVRDGKGLGIPQHPAVCLALAHTEGYRVMGRDRTPVFSPTGYPTRHTSTRPGSSPVYDTREWQRALVLSWWTNTYGLDIFNKHRDPPTEANPSPSKKMRGPFPSNLQYARLAEEYFRFALDPLLAPFNGGPPILDELAFPFGDIHRYAVQRVDAFWHGNVLQMARRSRQLQWIVLALQLGAFEWHHRFLFERTTYDMRSFDAVDEFVDASVPEPGPDADSLERRRFIAYYGLVYLGFNADPDLWNGWVRRAKARPVAGMSVSESIVFGNRLSLAGLGTTTQVIVGNMLRFTSALDAYLRVNLDVDGLFSPADLSDPGERDWR